MISGWGYWNAAVVRARAGARELSIGVLRPPRARFGTVSGTHRVQTRAFGARSTGLIPVRIGPGLRRGARRVWSVVTAAGLVHGLKRGDHAWVLALGVAERASSGRSSIEYHHSPKP